MPSELEQLQRAAADLAAASSSLLPDVAERAGRLAERLATGRFHVSVVGEFKRGKSTLVNALLGSDVLPSGVLPLTAIATELSFGDPGATVVHLDGSQSRIGLHQLADYVTETRNPANERQVARVLVRLRSPILEPGLVLVDTPGLGSIYLHDEVARAAVLDADGAVLVLAADTPISEQERELVRLLAERQGPTFIVLNKADHLRLEERDEVRRFVVQVLADELGRKPDLHVISARAALAARLSGAAPGEDGLEFAEFESAFVRFVTEHLVEARLVTARRELGRLGGAVRDGLALHAAALELDASAMAAKVSAFTEEVSRQRQAFDDERHLLARDVKALHDEVSAHLAEFATTAPTRWMARLEEVGATVPVRRLEGELRACVEQAVRAEFDTFREQEAGDAAARWQALAERFRARTQDRVNAVREAAAGLFAISLPTVEVPPVEAETERFFYLFCHLGTMGEPLSRLARRLLPASIVRRRLVERFRQELVREFDKHAGRARWDLGQRLDAVRRRFEQAMAAELDSTIATIVGAAARAEELRTATESARRSQHEATRQAQAAARHAVELAEGLA